MSARSGRSLGRRYRVNRAILLALDDLCWLCGHPGARTADHITPPCDWPVGSDGQLLPGLDDLDNLRPAHGTMGATGALNRCPTCGLLCNQSRGNRALAPSPRSEAW